MPLKAFDALGPIIFSCVVVTELSRKKQLVEEYFDLVSE